jgi:hypothetical protein
MQHEPLESSEVNGKSESITGYAFALTASSSAVIANDSLSLAAT